MKTSSKLAVIMLAGTLFFVTGCATSHRASTAYEYRVVRGVTHQSDLQDKLNIVGADGFAIVSAQTLPEHDNIQAETIVILKRAK